jgi:hypothetical protein
MPDHTVDPLDEIASRAVAQTEAVDDAGMRRREEERTDPRADPAADWTKRQICAHMKPVADCWLCGEIARQAAIDHRSR